ncbi:MAG: hypothetical protein R3183_08555 [Oleiphilaceae bacterium]|nr:hypothetical protein [Oleiphilaceae bacterium]
MTSHKDQAQDTAKAMLALGMSREQGEFRVPSNEELAMLLDPQSKEQLDATRRAQIMDAIANDPDTFSRWMAAVETAETLEIGHFATDVVMASQKQTDNEPALISRLLNFVSDHLKAVLATGGATAMAMGLAIVFLVPTGMDSQVSRLYDDYGSTWASKPEIIDVIRGGEQDSSALSAPDQRLQQGVAAGLKRLGEGFDIRNLNITSRTDVSELAPSLSESLFALGQIAAMSHFKCSLGAADAYYAESWKLINELAPAIRTADDETSKAISKVLDRQGKAETQVCRVGKLVISRVTR